MRHHRRAAALSEPFLASREASPEDVTLFPPSPEAQERAQAYLRPIRREVLMGTLDDLCIGPRHRADAWSQDILQELRGLGYIEEDHELRGYIRATAKGRDEACRWIASQYEKGGRR